MYCENCGKALPEGTRFCTQCGTRVRPLHSGSVPPMPAPHGPYRAYEKPIRSRSKKAAIFICVAVIVLAAGAAGWFFLPVHRGGNEYLITEYSEYSEEGSVDYDEVYDYTFDDQGLMTDFSISPRNSDDVTSGRVIYEGRKVTDVYAYYASSGYLEHWVFHYDKRGCETDGELYGEEDGEAEELYGTWETESDHRGIVASRTFNTDEGGKQVAEYDTSFRYMPWFEPVVKRTYYDENDAVESVWKADMEFDRTAGEFSGQTYSDDEPEGTMTMTVEKIKELR